MIFIGISPSHTWLIILIRFITLKNNWKNPCVKTEGKCNESVNNEFKIMRKRDLSHQIMIVSKNETNSPYSCLFNYFFNSLFWYNEFAEVRQDSLHFDSIMKPIHYESISVTWAIAFVLYLLKLSRASGFQSIFISFSLTLFRISFKETLHKYI